MVVGGGGGLCVGWLAREMSRCEREEVKRACERRSDSGKISHAWEGLWVGKGL